MYLLIIAIVAYLVGALPSAYLIARVFKNIDIRSAGSGNVGGMNTYRVAGLLPGIITVLLDMAKGAAAVLIASQLTDLAYATFVAAILSVLGHNFSIFISFKGGKGLATSAGAFLVLSPLSILYAIIFAIALTVILKDTNTAFGLAALIIPLILALQYSSVDWIIFGAAIAATITVKHLPDFRSYWEGRRKVFPEKS